MAVFVFASQSADADTWDMPRPAKYLSSNERFVLEVFPGRVCRAVLAEKSPTGDLTEVSRVRLTNSLSPVSAMVSDDGLHFITFDEWHRIGYGNAVLAFYDHRGLLRNYSLEEMVGQKEELGSNLDSLFPHTVSSRRWRSHCVMLFGENRQAGRLGIWLDWKPGWFVWNLSDGKQVETSGQVTADWDAFGDQWARSKLEKGTDIKEKVTACRYLLYRHRPEDRHALTKALSDGCQDLNQRQWLRLNADRALAIWDGEATSFSEFDRPVPKHHYMLGTVEVTLRLPHPAAQGQVYLMLFSSTVKESDWRRASPEFRGGRSFRALNGRPVATNEVHLLIDPALPGKYWLKAVWDRKAPFTYDLWSLDGFQAWLASTNNEIAFGIGDAASGAPEVFEVKAKEVLPVTLECVNIQ